jgi:cytoskeleton protein RodZ
LRQSFEQSEKQVSGFGERLRREREMRGISLEDITAATKIGKRLLRALEEEQFDLLPGGIFNKGYVRAYAKYIGIDEEQAVAEYLAAAGEIVPDARVIAEQDLSGRLLERVRRDDSDDGGQRFPFVPVLVLVVVIAGAAGGWQVYRQRVRERAQPTVSATEGMRPSMSTTAGTTVLDKGPSAAQTAPAAGDAAATSDAGASFEITVRARDRAWVSIKSDGKILVKGVIQPPDVKTIRATSQIVFWTGNAGVLELSFNGTNIPLSSGANDEQKLVFNVHGLETRPATQ